MPDSPALLVPLPAPAPPREITEWTLAPKPGRFLRKGQQHTCQARGGHGEGRSKPSRPVCVRRAAGRNPTRVNRNALRHAGPAAPLPAADGGTRDSYERPVTLLRLREHWNPAVSRRKPRVLKTKYLSANTEACFGFFWKGFMPSLQHRKETGVIERPQGAPPTEGAASPRHGSGKDTVRWGPRPTGA